MNEGKRNSGPVDHFNSEDHSGDQGKCWDWQISVIPQLPIYWSFLLTIRTCPIYKNGYCARTGQWETSRPQRSCLNGPFLPVSTVLRVKWMNALRFPAGKFKYFGLNATHRSRSVLHAHLLSFFFLMLSNRKHPFFDIKTTSKRLSASVRITIGATRVLNFPAVWKKRRRPSRPLFGGSGDLSLPRLWAYLPRTFTYTKGNLTLFLNNKKGTYLIQLIHLGIFLTLQFLSTQP